jgi:hypothetical protein
MSVIQPLSAQKSKKSAFIVAAFCALPLLVTACNGGIGPMPTGYTYYNKIYKGKYDAAGNPCTTACNSDVTQSYQPGKGGYVDGGNVAQYAVSQSSSLWEPAAIDLVNRMLNELGKPMETVYIHRGAYPEFEVALTHAMEARGIKVFTQPGYGPFTVDYVIEPMAQDAGIEVRLLSVGKNVINIEGTYRVFNDRAPAAQNYVDAPVASAPVASAPVASVPVVSETVISTPAETTVIVEEYAAPVPVIMNDNSAMTPMSEPVSLPKPITAEQIL